MVIIAQQESESAEWLDEDEVECSGSVIPDGISDEPMPICDVQEHLARMSLEILSIQ